MSTLQRKVLVVGLVAVGATLIAVLGLDWFHARMNLANGIRAKLDVGLRTVRSCLDERCESQPIGSDSAFGLFATFTFWVSILFAVAIAIQVASRIVMERVIHQPLTTIAIILGVMSLGGLIVCGVILGPTEDDSSVAVVIHRTWAMTLLLAGVVAGFWEIHLAVGDDEMGEPRPPLVDKPVYVPRARAALAEHEGIELAADASRERDPFLPPDDK